MINILTKMNKLLEYWRPIVVTILSIVAIMQCRQVKHIQRDNIRLRGYFVIIRVFDKYFKSKVYAENIEDVEQVIKKTIIEFEYQIMNIYKANE